jgi:hypothetical protein
MDMQSEAVMQEKGSWFLVHDNTFAHSAMTVKHFLAIQHGG